MLDTEAISLFLALLAVVAQLATLAAVVLAAGGRFSPTLRALGRRAVDAVAPSALTLAGGVAAVCTAGSLYFSEIAHYPPCHLCWLQRYCMYPLVPILAFAAWSRRRWARLVAGGLAAAGAAISAYHILVERGVVAESASCDPENPCSLVWVKELGYLTIPTMALSGFLLIVTLLALSRAGDSTEPSDLARSEAHGHR